MFSETGDVKASIAVLSFIISNATRFGVDSESLSSELQQLGFPKGSDAIDAIVLRPGVC